MAEEHDWLNTLFDRHPEIKNIQLADHLGTAGSTVTKMRNGQRGIKFGEIAQIREFFNIIEGEAESGLPVIKPLSYKGKDYAAKAVHIPLPNKAHTGHYLITITNNDMAPTYLSGDFVVVDTAINAFEGAGLYAIDHGGIVILRHIEPDFEDPAKVILMADNPSIKTHTLAMSGVTIIGKGVFAGKQL